MLLNTSTIRNLYVTFQAPHLTHAYPLIYSEIYRNQTDFTEKGTLFSVLNHTTTMFGKRLLKSWVGRPLVDKTFVFPCA
jgi:DNA mismatch repair ATPase MutS